MNHVRAISCVLYISIESLHRQHFLEIIVMVKNITYFIAYEVRIALMSTINYRDDVLTSEFRILLADISLFLRLAGFI